MYGKCRGSALCPSVLPPCSYPVWWMAPFFSGSGYSSEAINYILSLLRHNQVGGTIGWEPARCRRGSQPAAGGGPDGGASGQVVQLRRTPPRQTFYKRSAAPPLHMVRAIQPRHARSCTKRLLPCGFAACCSSSPVLRQIRQEDLWLTHHGDHARDSVVQAMAPLDRE